MQKTKWYYGPELKSEYRREGDEKYRIMKVHTHLINWTDEALSMPHTNRVTFFKVEVMEGNALIDQVIATIVDNLTWQAFWSVEVEWDTFFNATVIVHSIVE